VTDTTTTENRCYRHPDRESFVHCQRCGRTICGQCQTPAAVGVHCPECMREARQSSPRSKPRLITAFSSSSDAPVVTYVIIAISAVVSLLSLVPGAVGKAVLSSTVFFAVAPAPWTFLSSIFLTPNFISLLFSLLFMFFVGRLLESLIGRVRFAAFFLVSALGGTVATFALGGQDQAGLSPAIFAAAVAVFVIGGRRVAFNNVYLFVIVAINAGYSIFAGQWQAPIGGILVGAILGLIFRRTRRIRQSTLQIVLVAVVVIVLVAVAIATNVENHV